MADSDDLLGADDAAGQDWREEVDYEALGAMSLRELALLRQVLRDPLATVPGLMAWLEDELKQKPDPDLMRIYQQMLAFLLKKTPY